MSHIYPIRMQVWLIDGHQFKQNMFTCGANCLRDTVKINCGCVMGFYTSTATYTNLRDTPFCLNLKDDFDIVANRSVCMNQALQPNIMKCNSNCHPSCKEYRYHKKSFSAKWPRKSQYIPFYKKYINGSSYQDKFAELQRMIQLNNEGNTSEARKLLAQTTLIEDNFLRLSVHLSSIDVVTVTDHKAITSFDLLANIGGTLNLYSGISFIIIIEIIDFLFNLLFSSTQHDKTEK